ncbi:MAG: hypothetical protein F4X40_10110 [Chloroflexi bacterium]|nr:hypothetical protein [Chloroflexota bacterium]
MAEEANGERMWSDGESVFRVATVGVRVFAGFLDWIFTLGVAAILGAISATVYNAVFADERVVSYWSVTAIVVTVVHIAPVFMVARRGEKPGYTALRLLAKRDMRTVPSSVVSTRDTRESHRRLAPLDSRSRRNDDTLSTVSVRTVDSGRIGWGRALARGVLGSPGLTMPWLAIGIQNVIVFGVEISSEWFGTSNSFTESLGGYGIGFWSVTLMVMWIAVPMLVVVNHAWMIFDAKGRGLHDLIVGTVVVGGSNAGRFGLPCGASCVLRTIFRGCRI